MGDIEVRDVVTAAQREAFLRLPHRIFANDPAWVPPLDADERCKLLPGCHPFYEHGEARFWLAYRGGELVGRISGQINSLLPARPGGRVAHFGMLDAIDAPEVFAALVGAAAEWARSRGCTVFEGPYNLSINEEFGVLVDGFDEPPCVMMAHTPAYYLPRLEALGLRKARDFFHWRLYYDAARIEEYRRLAARIRLPAGCILRPSTRRGLRDDFRKGLDVYNDAWRDQWGFVPVTPRETAHLATRLRYIFNPNGLIVAEYNGRPCGICCGIPDYNMALRHMGGKLLPFGWAKMAAQLATGKIDRTRLILLGVSKEFHKTAFGAMLHLALIARFGEYALAAGYRQCELAWMIEDNRDMLRLGSQLGAKPVKTYRVLTMPL